MIVVSIYITLRRKTALFNVIHTGVSFAKSQVVFDFGMACKERTLEKAGRARTTNEKNQRKTNISFHPQNPFKVLNKNLL